MANEKTHPPKIDPERARIVIVEDNLKDSEYIVRVLQEKNLDGQTIFIKDEEGAFAYLINLTDHYSHSPWSTPSVIFLDLELPQGDGMELLRRIKSDMRTRHIPVVIFSSSSQVQKIQTAYDHGANSYVIKPVSFDEFTQTMAELVSYWTRINRLPTR